MARFNLIDEPWILVMVNKRGETKQVSLRDLFLYAHEYVGLAGEMETQNFAVLRVLLAIMQTVFSRFDSQGDPYGVLEINSSMQAVSAPTSSMQKLQYEEELLETWDALWQAKRFPNVIVDYLECWHDRFFLFDDEYPFFQVVEEELSRRERNIFKPTPVSGKQINFSVSESGNKVALFSPKYEYKSNKAILTKAELARWLIAYQGYTGTSSKSAFKEITGRNSKGWIYDLGGIYLEGQTLFETLMLNMVLVHPESEYTTSIQRPCWEFSGSDLIDRYLDEGDPDNLAELYTNWSRAIYIDPESDMEEAFELLTVKLPEVVHENNFLEPMTIWRFNSSGESRGNFTPRKHQADRSLWRSFGSIYPRHESEESYKPGIISWFESLDIEIDPSIKSVSMRDDGKAPSWMPTDEILDELNLHREVALDLIDAGWINRVNEMVDLTQDTISKTFGCFIRRLLNLRGIDSKEQIDNATAELYSKIDYSFRNWLSSLSLADDMDERVQEWKESLKNIVSDEANRYIKNATHRDFRGKTEDGERVINIAVLHSDFSYWLNKGIG